MRSVSTGVEEGGWHKAQDAFDHVPTFHNVPVQEQLEPRVLVLWTARRRGIWVILHAGAQAGAHQLIPEVQLVLAMES